MIGGGELFFAKSRQAFGKRGFFGGLQKGFWRTFLVKKSGAIFARLLIFARSKTKKMLDHQEVWIVPPDRRVELFHSPRLGKLLVLCDAKPVVASAEAFGEGDWDFLIDDELFQIALRRRGLEFFYALRRDRAAATVQNLARKKAERAAFWWPLVIFLVAAAAAIWLLF